ncbi:MAG: hypothetical protein KDK26_08345 [Roseivivax sp.]|nr:hypothetical protein [Roseivivax sp.]
MAYRFGLFAALAFSALSGATAASSETVTIDPTQRFQTINGWEATVDVEWDKAFEPYKDEMFRRVVDEIGINRVRVGIYAGTENTDRSWDRWKSGEMTYKQYRGFRYVTKNDNDDPFVINPAGFDFANLDWRIENMVWPLQKLLAARGEKLFVNINYVAFTDQSVKRGVRGEYIHDNPEEYAEFVLATYQHMDAKYGFLPDAWEVILEPDMVEEWRRDPALIGRAMAAAGKRLREAGYTPNFVAPSVTDMANTVPYLQAILSVPGAQDVLGEVSYHRYRHGSRRVLRGISYAASQIGKPPAMLEWWFGNADTSILFQDMTEGNNGVWAGRALPGLIQLQDGRLEMPEDTRFTSLYTAFVRAGATRIGTQTDTEGALPLAFANPGGSVTVAARSTGAGPVTVQGLPAGDYRLFWATNTACGTNLPLTVGSDGRTGFDMPGEGAFAVTSLPPDPAIGDEFLTNAKSARCPRGS